MCTPQNMGTCITTELDIFFLSNKFGWQKYDQSYLSQDNGKGSQQEWLLQLEFVVSKMHEFPRDQPGEVEG